MESDSEISVSRRRRYPCTCLFCKNGERHVVNGKRQHICHYTGCGRMFTKCSQLTIHLRSHSGEKPYLCDFYFCGKRFSRSDELSRHKRIHYDDKSYKCSDCDKSFTRSDHLTKHMRTHIRKRAPTPMQEEIEAVYIKSEPESDTSDENNFVIIEEDNSDLEREYKDDFIEVQLKEEDEEKEDSSNSLFIPNINLKKVRGRKRKR